MARRSMWLGMIVVAGLAATAVAQPSGGSGSGAGSAVVTPPAPPPVDPKALRAQCEAAMQADKDWNAELFEQVKSWNATQLLDQSQAAHELDAAEIAKNKKHVVLAYAAMWLIAAGFLVFMWRRQQGLKSQIADLKRDLDAAIKDAK